MLRHFRITLALLLSAAAQSFAQSPLNYTDLWWNAAESGWGLKVTHHPDQLFVVWYTCDINGDAVFFTMPGCDLSSGGRFNGSTCAGRPYKSRGTPVTQASFAGAHTISEVVGEARLDFAQASQATFQYRVGDFSRNVNITRLPFGGSEARYPRDMSDLYYQADQSGWGLSVTQHGRQHFAVVYHYDERGQPLFLVMPDGREDHGVVTGNLYRPRSAKSSYATPSFNAADVSFVGASPVGQARYQAVGSRLALTYNYLVANHS